MSAEIMALAEHLYETAPARSYHPQWELLGEVTRSVWYERAQAQLLSEFA